MFDNVLFTNLTDKYIPLLYLTLLKISMSSLHIAGDLLYWLYYIDIYILHIWRGVQIGQGMFATSTSMDRKNLNKYLDLNVSCTIKLTKYFYLITVMVVGTSLFGQTLDTKVAGYNYPNYNWKIMFMSRDILKLYYFTKKK